MSQDSSVERELYHQEAGREWCHRLPPEDRGAIDLMIRYLRDRNLDAELAFNNYWYPSRAAGDQWLRVVTPASSEITGNHFWQARAVDKFVEKRYQSPHAPRGDAVIAVWPRGTPRITAVVEGPMDALAAAGEGCLGIALMGATPPGECFRLTAKLACGTMAIIVADSDALGAASKWALKLLNYGLGVKLTSPHPHKDLAEAPQRERRRILGLDPELAD